MIWIMVFKLLGLEMLFNVIINFCVLGILMCGIVIIVIVVLLFIKVLILVKLFKVVLIYLKLVKVCVCLVRNLVVVKMCCIFSVLLVSFRMFFLFWIRNKLCVLCCFFCFKVWINLSWVFEIMVLFEINAGEL